VPDNTLLRPAAVGRLLSEPSGHASMGRLIGPSAALAAVEIGKNADGPLVVVAGDPRQADQLEAEIRWFAGASLSVEHFVEWETLPWDSFSPHQDIVSQRLRVLGLLKTLNEGVVILSAQSMLQRLPPVDYVAARTLRVSAGEQLERQAFIESLSAAGYLRVPQVEEHGEYAVRGSLLDVFPMGYGRPLRIDFFDDDVESIRHFDAESQLSGDRIDAVRVLPAREVPLDDDDVRYFRRRYRERFEGRPAESRVYREVSDGIAHGGIEYYLPLFFESTANLVDYLPGNATVMMPADLESVLDRGWLEIGERYETGPGVA
jgi:transcription-repair coupling factor (superfamily II helicase)